MNQDVKTTSILPAPLAVVASIADRKATRLERTVALGLAIQGTVRVAKKWYESYRESAVYSITIDEKNQLYRPTLHWLSTHLEPQVQRAVSAEYQRSRKRRRDEVVSEKDTAVDGEGNVGFFYDGMKEQKISLDGHEIGVVLSRDSGGSRDGDSNDFFASFFKEVRLIFTAKTEAGREAVVELLKSIAHELSHEPPRLLVTQRWGGWREKDVSIVRPLSTVVLSGDTRERIVADMEKFLSEEQDYALWGLPWHRGYLFHGPAGTGKTSFAGALAAHFDLDVYYASLSGLDNDGSLIECFGSVDDRSILVIEDVDILHSARERTDEKQGVTLQGLLNALDGFVTPHGLITVMTTNNKSVLDPALVRRGRVDMDVEIGYVTNEQLEALCKCFLDVTWEFPPITSAVPPSDIVAIIKDHRRDLARVRGTILARIQGEDSNQQIVYTLQ